MGWGNIGACIIEGPEWQDTCQPCQPDCSYWIWPVMHTQICPVKIIGYIDFLFLCVCVCVALCEDREEQTKKDKGESLPT